MKEYLINISRAKLLELNKECPPDNKSSGNIGKRAKALIHIYLNGEGFKIEPKPPKGVDVAAKDKNGIVHYYEVKGTEKDDVAFNQLKVSGIPSHDKLTKDKMPIFRVMNVFAQKPKFVELYFFTDYTLEEEPRWKVKPKK